MKIMVPCTYFIDDLNGEKVVWTFNEKELRKDNKKSLEQKKQSKEGEKSYMSTGKAMIIHLMPGLIKKTFCKNESIFF